MGLPGGVDSDIYQIMGSILGLRTSNSVALR